MDLRDYKSLIDRIAHYAALLDLWHFGEPFLHPHIDDMIKYAANKKIRVRVSTNATLLGYKAAALLRCGLDTLIVSIDGASMETHQAYRRGSNFDEVVSAISELGLKKKASHAEKPHIVLQTLVTAFNEIEKEKLVDLARMLGVDRARLKTLSLGSWRTDKERKFLASKWLPKDPKFTRYIYDGIKLTLKSETPCRWVRQNGVVLWNGDLTICCYDFNGDHSIANVFEHDYLKVLRSKKMKLIRKKMASKNLALCHSCQNTKHIYVYDLPIHESEKAVTC